MSSEVYTEVEHPTLDTTSSFDVPSYLQERAAKEAFVMVEFGHDAKPVAYQQSGSFTGNRAYIGYEAWLRDPWNEKKARVQQLHEAFDGRSANIHYQTLALGGIIRTSSDSERWYDGDYKPATPLPNSSVDEVFIGNVFGDPHVSQSYERTHALLTEVKRIITEDGHIVIRETITPDRTNAHLHESLEAHGLTVVDRIESQNENWEDLEEQFGGGKFIDKGSFYLFLSK